jgi:hypothetical protein
MPCRKKRGRSSFEFRQGGQRGPAMQKHCLIRYLATTKPLTLREGKDMEESKDSYKREYRRISIKTTDGSTLVGKVNIGIKERVSELFTKTENPFIVIIDVEHQDIQGRVLFVNKNNIVWVEPED